MKKHIQIKVITTTPLPVGEQVFITGQHETLGDWRPDGFALSREGDNLWAGSLALDPFDSLEYKVTRGTWDTEEVRSDGLTQSNRLICGGDGEHVTVQVRAWKDRISALQPDITGNYRIHEAFHSEYVRRDRRIIVWLPPSYETELGLSYPVLYMHDGQQVFDPKTSTHYQDWEVDERCTQLIHEGRMQEIIVVAIYCTEDRYQEYHPDGQGDAYASFLVRELKPFIDKAYRTRPERECTAVAGASMGGTISFYLAWKYADTFFGCAALSPAFRYKGSEFNLAMVRESEQVPKLKIFLYCGRGDDLERELLGGMREMAGLLQEKGFVEGRDLVIAEEPLAEHNEAAWAAHTEEWLLLLFGRRTGGVGGGA